MRSVALVGILLSTSILGGCAATIGGISLSSISSFAGLASTLFTGADLGEHAASLITGKDCRFSEGLLRDDRDVCEEPGSLATRDDFHGIFVERIDPDGTIIYAAPKYMPASFGAGEYENKPDAIWAAIKTQKVAEENERQLARAQAAQTIDVAALATGSVSSQSLAFLPAGMTVDSDVDGETASQTASRPRTVSNAAPQVVAKREVKAPEIEVPIDTNQPAIDEKAFAASVQTTNGEGGPFIATATSSTPVASTLINGEPVVVLRLRPIFSATTPASAEATNAIAMPIETASADSPTTFITPANAEPSSTPSPLAILELQPARAALPTSVASIEPGQLVGARPRSKPAAGARAVEAEVTPAKPVRTATRVRRVEPEQPDVYQPPVRSDSAFDTASDATASAPVQVPGDIPAEQTAIPVTVPVIAPASEPAPPATGGPAPLVPMPQE